MRPVDTEHSEVDLVGITQSRYQHIIKKRDKRGLIKEGYTFCLQTTIDRDVESGIHVTWRAGVSKCSKCDRFSRRLGRRISSGRAEKDPVKQVSIIEVNPEDTSYMVVGKIHKFMNNKLKEVTSSYFNTSPPVRALYGINNLVAHVDSSKIMEEIMKIK